MAKHIYIFNYKIVFAMLLSAISTYAEGVQAGASTWYWTGILRMNNQVLVTLQNPLNHLQSGWLAIGNKLPSGETLIAYDGEQLLISQNGKIYKLRLQGLDSTPEKQPGDHNISVPLHGNFSCIVNGKLIEIADLAIGADDFTEIQLSEKERLGVKYRVLSDGRYEYTSHFTIKQANTEVEEANPKIVTSPKQEFSLMVNDKALNYLPNK